jgi:4'-phosphopantetheinyl transferase EntD
MAELGLAPTAILPGARGAPLWPEGVIGSMTHCLDYCAAAVSLDKRIKAIGIDAEIDEPLPDKTIIGMIASREEQSHLKDLQGSQPGINWDRLLFSAKESIFKAWYPFLGIELEFENAQLRFSKVDRSFTCQLLRLSGRHESLNALTFKGNWNSHRGIVGTSVLL